MSQPDVDALRARPLSLAERRPILFRSDRGKAGYGDLYAMAADGSGVQRLTEGGDFAMPVWSPDGQTIAFRQRDGVDASVGLLTPEDQTTLPLASGEDPLFWDRTLAWSRSGDRLLYTSKHDEVLMDIWTMSRAGGSLERLLPEATGIRDGADLFPGDGSIVYRWTPDQMGGDNRKLGSSNLWLATGRDDREPRNLTRDRVFAANLPRWSPDGTRVAFAGYALAPDGSIEGFAAHGGGMTAPDAEIFVLDVATDELTRVTDNEFADAQPCWTPDGEHLLIVSDQDGDEDIWRLSLTDPNDAVDLIDDAAEPASDAMPYMFLGLDVAR